MYQSGQPVGTSLVPLVIQFTTLTIYLCYVQVLSF